MNLFDAEPEIRAALERLNEKPERSKPFVVVTAKACGRERFVQFYGSRQRGVNLDLPLAQFDRAELISPPRWSDVAPLKPSEHGYEVQGCTAEQGAAYARAILLESGFSFDAVVEIEEYARGTGVA